MRRLDVVKVLSGAAYSEELDFILQKHKSLKLMQWRYKSNYTFLEYLAISL